MVKGSKSLGALQFVLYPVCPFLLDGNSGGKENHTPGAQRNVGARRENGRWLYFIR